MLNSPDSLEAVLSDQTRSSLIEQLLRLNEVDLKIARALEIDDVLQEVTDGACYLTGAQYGVLALLDEFGGIQQTVTSGVDAHQLEQMTTPPVGNGLLGYLNETEGTLRVADIASHPRSVGLPADHPHMTTFLGVQLRHGDQHLGNVYLGEKRDGLEFTELDEELIQRFAEHAGAAITNSLRFERERKIKTDLRALVKIAPVGLVVFDARTGEVLTSNQECQRIGGAVGSSSMTWQETFENVTMYRADGRELPVGDRPATQVLQSGEIVRGEEITLHFSDGRIVNTLINAAPIYSDRGEILSVVVAMQDMAFLEDAERMRAEYLGMVSHELRTPLTTIKGSIVALADIVEPLNNAEPLQLLQIIDNQSELMRGQINSLIDLTQIDAGTLRLSPQSVDVAGLVADSVREFRRKHSGFNVRQEIPEDLPNVMIDRDRISQVLRDVFAHAFKFASDASTVSVTAEQEDLHVAFSIEIESARAHAADPTGLMERMRSAAGDDGIKTYLGDGLALSICRGLVEAHGGRFSADTSDCGHGSTFSFTIPIAGDMPNEAGGASQLQADGSLRDDPIRILVAADNPQSVATTRRALSNTDFAILEAFDDDHLDELMVDGQPHLILFDLANGRRERLDLMHRLFTSHDVPIIALMGQWDELRSVQALGMGADGYMVKPIAGSELIARIRATLRRWGRVHPSDPSNGYAAGHVTVDYGAHTLAVEGAPIQLTATEYKLLYELSSKAGRVLTQDELLHRVWGPEYSGESQLLRAYIKSLRQKLGDNARNPSYIFTEHGTGYRMAKP